MSSAEELMRPVVASQEDDVEALNLLANALLKQDKTDEAIELLEKAASLQPDSAVAQLRLGAGLLAVESMPAGLSILKKPSRWTPSCSRRMSCWCSTTWTRRILTKR